MCAWLTNLALSISINSFLDLCTKIKFGGSPATPLSIKVDYLYGSLLREHDCAREARVRLRCRNITSTVHNRYNIQHFNPSPCVNRNVHMRMSTSAHLLDFQLQCDFKIVLLKLQYNDRHIEKSCNEYYLKLKINLRRRHILWQWGGA